jgi:hypothetical protein
MEVRVLVLKVVRMPRLVEKAMLWVLINLPR